MKSYQNFKLAIRNLIKNKLNSIIIIVSITLGFSAAFIILSWARFEYSYDSYHQKKDRIYRVLDHQTYKGQEEQYLAQIPEYLVNTFEEEIPGIELSTILLENWGFWIRKDEESIQLEKVYFTDRNLFNIFSFNFLHGDPETCFLSNDNAVITKKTSLKLFGNENPIGQKIIQEGNKEYIVSAVIEDIPSNSHLDFNMLISIDPRKPGWDRNNGNHNASIYVLLKEGVYAKDLAPALSMFTDKHFSWNTKETELELQPLRELHLGSTHTMWEMNKNKFDRTYINILCLIAFLVLAISSINFLNLSIVNLSKRKSEIGIKKINGSGKFQIIAQFMVEHSITIIISCLLTILVIANIYPYINNNFFNGYNFREIYNLRSIVLFFGIIASLFLLIGLYSSITIASFSAKFIVSGIVSGQVKRKTFKQTLIVSQLAVSTFLMIATFIIYSQMQYIKNKNLGIKTKQVMILPTIDDVKNNYPILKEELQKNPRIIDISASSRSFGDTFWRNSIHFEDQKADTRYVIPYLITDNNFPEFYDMELIEGHSFSKTGNGNSDFPHFIINESLAKELGYDNPIGKKMRFSHTKMGEIIGVVKDFHFQSLHNPIESMAFYVGKEELNSISVKIDPLELNNTLSYIENIWKEFRPDRPFSYYFLDDGFAQLYTNDARTTKLVFLFTILSIMLSSLGLFGLISYVSEMKTKEIGVRKVNGAKISEIITMLNKNYILYGIFGFIIACPIAYYAMTEWLNNFAYKIDLKWEFFLMAGITSILITFLAVSIQSLRAAIKNPVEALRYE